MRLEANEFGERHHAFIGGAEAASGERDDTQGLRDLVAVLPLGFVAKARFLQAMADPRRRYGGLARLDRLWRRHTVLWPEANIDGATVPLIACALAFRTSALAPGAGLDPVRSADAWLAASAHGMVSADARAWVAATIVSDTCNAETGAAGRGDAQDRARDWVLDLDRSTLGERPEIFDGNLALLRAEAPARAGEWQNSLNRALGRFAALEPLYRSDAIARRFAEPARRNLARHLEGLPIAA